MYVANHLKWRILIARTLKEFFFESENSFRNYMRVFESYGKYLLGTTYDTFLTYLNKKKYDVSQYKLPSYIVAALALLENMKITCERLSARKKKTSWSLIDIGEELLAVMHEQERQGKKQRKITID